MSDEGADTSSESLDEEDELLGHSYDESEGEDDSDFEYVGCESRSGSDDGGAADERDEGSDEGSDCGASSAGSEEGATPECVLCGGPTELETITEEEHLEGKCDCCERELRRAEEVDRSSDRRHNDRGLGQLILPRTGPLRDRAYICCPCTIASLSPITLFGKGLVPLHVHALCLE